MEIYTKMEGLMFKGHKSFLGATKLLIKLLVFGVTLSVGVLGFREVAFATDSTLTITLSENAVTADVAPTATPFGSFIQSSGLTIGVSTNNATGYELKISASDTTAPNRLKNGSSYLQSIATPTTLSNFRNADLSSTDLATSLGLSDCTQITESSNCKGIWGYKPSKLNSSVNESFLPSPGTNGNTIDQTTEANTTANSYTVTLGAKVSPLATIGTYTNTFIVTATGNPIPYTFSYYENIASNMPADSSSTSGSTTVNLSSTAPTRAGFKFNGWCDQATTKSGNNDVCATGHVYQPGVSYTLDATGTVNNIKLYAIWQEEICAGYSTMQSLSSSNVGTLLPNVGSTATVCDARDETKYTIGKLADGKIWLLDNLALDLTNSTVLNGMNEDNTNASNTTLGYLKGTTTRDPSTDANGQYATAAVSNWIRSNSFSAPLVNMTNKDVIPTDATSTAGGYKVGGYYNCCAATAGSYCYGNGTSQGTTSGNATEDICPKGWRMPTGLTTGEYSALANAIYGSTGSTSDAIAYAYYRSALHLPLSGYFNYGSASNHGSDGGWWSSTRVASDSRYMSRLAVTTSSITPVYSINRSSGFSVRCVLGS